MDFNLEKHIQASKAPKSVKRAGSKMPKGLVSKAKHEALKKKTDKSPMNGVAASIHEAMNKGHKVNHGHDPIKSKCASCDYFD